MSDLFIQPNQLVTHHPVAENWPLASEEQHQTLAASIAAQGVKEPVTVTRSGLLLDGRNRLRAAQDANVPCPYVVVDDMDDEAAWAFCTARNDERRHTTSSQRAIVAARDPRFQPKKGGATLESTNVGTLKTAELAASAHSTSRRYVEQARFIIATDPDTEARVLAGEQPIDKAFTEAKRIAAERTAQQQGDQSCSLASSSFPVSQQSSSSPSSGSSLTTSSAPAASGDSAATPPTESPEPEGPQLAITKERWAEIEAEYKTIIAGIEDTSHAIKTFDERAGYPLPREHLQAALKNVINTIKRSAMPYGVCPYCFGYGADQTGGDCTGCNKQGWLPRTMYQQAPADLRKATPRTLP